MSHTTWMLYGATGATGTLIAEEAWLELGEGYHFTAGSLVQAIEHVLRDHPSGVLTPAQAFGVDFVLTIEGVRQWPATPLTHTLQEKRNDLTTLDQHLGELRRVGPPPHLNSKSFGTRAKWVTNFGGANRQETYTRLLLKTLRQLVLSRDYALSDIVGTLRGIGFTQAALWRRRREM